MDFLTGYIGTYTHGTAARGKGIYAFRMNPVSGAITDIQLAAEADNPSWICVNGKNLYAVSELDNFHRYDTGAVSAYAIMRDGSLEFINQQASGGTHPCHLAIFDKRHDTPGAAFILAANYGSGSVAVFPLEDAGWIADMCQHIQLDGSGPNRSRQEGPHAHAAVFNATGDFIFVHDLGSDRIMTYRFDPLAEKPLRAAEFPWYTGVPGSGPRHGAFSASGNFLYSVNELDASLDVLRLDSSSGKLEEVQRIADASGMSAALVANYPAEICVRPDGKFLCISHRGHDTIAVYKTDAAGTLDFINAFPTGGKWPRHCTFDPRGRFLLVANQKSDAITVFSIDTDSGMLTQTGTFPVPSPACIAFASA